MAVCIVTDSTNYLPQKLIAAHNITQVSLYVTEQEKSWREVEVGALDSFYEKLRSGLFMKTSQPSVGDFVAAYENILKNGNDIVSLHISSGISGTVSTAEQAAEIVQQRYPDRSIETVDSQTSGGGLGLAVLAASVAAKKTRSPQIVSHHVREALDHLKIWFCLDTLDYLQRGGRIGRTQAWVGSALQIKPILYLKGEIQPVERVRTRQRALVKMVEYMHTLRDQGLDGWAIQHIQAPEQAENLVTQGREIFETEPAFVSEVGPVLGSYTGPGMIGVGGIPKRYLEELASISSTPAS